MARQPSPQVKELARKRIWTVSDLAEFAGLSHERARRAVQRLHEASGGNLLLPSKGKNRRFTFHVGALRKLAPELFAPIEDVMPRVEALEERFDEMNSLLRIVATQTGANTRRIEALSSKSKRPAKGERVAP